jgi:hypothetical protein
MHLYRTAIVMGWPSRERANAPLSVDHYHRDVLEHKNLGFHVTIPNDVKCRQNEQNKTSKFSSLLGSWP